MVCGRDDADAARAVAEDLVVREQRLVARRSMPIDGLEERVANRSAHAGGQVVLHAAGAEVVEHHAAAGDLLEEVEDRLAVAEREEERREAPRSRPHAANHVWWLVRRHSSLMSTRRYCALGGTSISASSSAAEQEREFGVEAGDVVAAVDQRGARAVRARLAELLDAAVQVAVGRPRRPAPARPRARATGAARRACSGAAGPCCSMSRSECSTGSPGGAAARRTSGCGERRRSRAGSLVSGWSAGPSSPWLASAHATSSALHAARRHLEALAQRVALEVVAQHDAAQVRVAVEHDAEQVVDLALERSGAGPERRRSSERASDVLGQLDREHDRACGRRGA